METKYLQFFNPDSGEASDSVNVSQVTKGRPVQGTKFEMAAGELSASKVAADQYGFIAGFARNTSEELCLLVQWEDGETRPVHPANLILL